MIRGVEPGGAARETSPSPTLDQYGRDLTAEAPPYYQLHVLIGLALFALWPFTRLVHAFSAPIGYLFRPYIVYRSREVAAKDELVGSQPRRRGW